MHQTNAPFLSFFIHAVYDKPTNQGVHHQAILSRSPFFSHLSKATNPYCNITILRIQQVFSYLKKNFVTVQVGLRIYFADCKKEYNRNEIG